ncbi:MAG TPA: hypothetical protein VHU42_00820 [Rhodopila sp.]|jgi:hypothetical protein|nr:hypothetical protein [Rhodopila sp.]
MQAVERGDDGIGVLQQDRFGDFQFKPPSGQTGGEEDLLDQRKEARALGLQGREIDGDAHMIGPLHRVGARRCGHPLADRHDQPCLFGYGYELVGRDEPAGWTVPSDQCLETGDAILHQIIQRLVVKDEFVAD